MIIIKKKQSTFYVKEESIVWEYNNQYSSFNVYALQNRKKFKDFKIELLDSQRSEYDSVGDVLGLAMRHGLRGMLGHRPIISENDVVIK